MTDGNGDGNGGLIQLTAKDFKSDQEVRWCPGCGDYAILAAMQGFMPELGIPRERIVFISGIGCAARFPYYMQTYGMHSIHGNHLIHALRRNVNVKILLFNNQIYGLTKGQYSPTSPLGTRNKSTPMGSLDWPFNPVSIALGAEASFVGRSIDTDKKHLTEVLRRAANHRGSALVEIYQNCNVYNDGAFDAVKEQTENQIRLVHGQPIRFGAEDERGVKLRVDGSCELVSADEGGLLVHDEREEVGSLAFALSRISHTPHGPTPIGIFRDVERPVYDELMAAQLDTAKAERGEGDLKALIHAGDTWVV